MTEELEDLKGNIPTGESNPDKVMIESIDLYKSFGENHVLKGFNCTLKEGENLVILGKSGSGKTVLIKCVVGLIKPDSGTLKVFGKNVSDMNTEGINEIRKDIGFLFQGSALYDSMTVKENLEFPLRRTNFHYKAEERMELITEALRGVGLEHALNLMPSELSGGMKKRVALARTLILRPRIILYDEPTTGLDPVTGREISNLILEIQEKYKTASIIITHDMICASVTANRIILLLDGKNYVEGTFEELKKMTDPKIKAFFI